MRGGKRASAGRPKGTRNKASAAREAETKATGETPIEFMLKVMRDDGEDPARRLDAAKSVAPYIHPKLANVSAEVKGSFDVAIKSIERLIVDHADD